MQSIKRIKVLVKGNVQGVGFRPFVYKLAKELKINGFVLNSFQGVVIEAEAVEEKLLEFIARIKKEKPIISTISSIDYSFETLIGFTNFEIRKSQNFGKISTAVMPDITICDDCLKEIFNPNDRRYLYPFTNCTQCGPRFSIIEALPYDRKNTSMKKFEMCSICKEEFENPESRRFHAQPNACSQCGPNMELFDANKKSIAQNNEAIKTACNYLKQGHIVAVKGLGGFHLMVDAINEKAVEELRKRKNREQKPFAVMFKSIDSIKQFCYVSNIEENILKSKESPIVLLQKNKVKGIAENVSPKNPLFGAMIAYTPLHQIILKEFGKPLIATSGNIADEPICIDETDAFQRLKGIADFFLIHNRPIVRHVDDSIARIIAEKIVLLRRSRGYPLLAFDSVKAKTSVLAVGGHLKNTIALSENNHIFLSQHIGNLDSIESVTAFKKIINDLSDFYDIKPNTIVSDLHPDYFSTQFASKYGLPVVKLQHHFAHILSCMAENNIEDNVLGVAFDGTGYGLDKTIWGGEFLLVDKNNFKRFAHFKTFSLVGGEKSIKETSRTAIGLLFEIFGEKLFEMKSLKPLNKFSEKELKIFKKMLENNINSPKTSSTGRLFDAVSAICGICLDSSFEGEAAMQLEYAINGFKTDKFYNFELLNNNNSLICDWSKMIKEIINDLKNNVSVSEISAKFHNTLAEIIVSVAKVSGNNKVVLSGGCFQNKYLTEKTISRLREEKFSPFFHSLIPSNDGGISIGQIFAVNNGLVK
ncbi:MAG: carbamoyltransferase HypF [archaeon]|nr:carbamoyltransferase HypF [archaeon]